MRRPSCSRVSKRCRLASAATSWTSTVPTPMRRASARICRSGTTDSRSKQCSNACCTASAVVAGPLTVPPAGDVRCSNCVASWGSRRDRQEFCRVANDSCPAFVLRVRAPSSAFFSGDVIPSFLASSSISVVRRENFFFVALENPAMSQCRPSRSME